MFQELPRFMVIFYIILLFARSYLTCSNEAFHSMIGNRMTEIGQIIVGMLISLEPSNACGFQCLPIGLEATAR